MFKKKIEKPTLKEDRPAPVIDLVIRYDGRIGQVGLTVIGGDMDFKSAYRLLEAARGVVQQQEREALLKQAQIEQQKGPTLKDLEDAINRQTPIEVQMPAG